MKQKQKKQEPTLLQIAISLAISSLMGWMVYNGLEKLIDELIKATLHSWLETPVLIGSTLAICSLIPATVWAAHKMAYKMAEQNEKKASDI